MRTEPLEIVEATNAAVRAARRSREALARAADAQQGTVRLDDIDLPVAVVRAVSRMLDELAAGHAIALHAVVDDADELTTSQAARLLGVSRPTLITLLDRGEIAYRMVRSHRRLAAGDVLAYRRTAQRAPDPTAAERRERLADMAETTDRLGLGY